MAYLSERGVKKLISLIQNGVIRSAEFLNIYRVDAETIFYFGQVLPFDYKESWAIHYRIRVTDPLDDNATQSANITISGISDKLSTYRTENVLYDISRHSASNHIVLPVSQNAYFQGKGVLIGIDFRDTLYAEHPKSIAVDLMERHGCDFQFLDKASTPDELDLTLNEYPRYFTIPFDKEGTYTDNEFDIHTLSAVAVTGSYNDLLDKPDLLKVDRDKESLVFTMN